MGFDPLLKFSMNGIKTYYSFSLSAIEYDSKEKKIVRGMKRGSFYKKKTSIMPYHDMKRIKHFHTIKLKI